MTGRPIKPILEQDADPQIALGRRAELRAQHKEARVKLGRRLADSPEPGLARAEELYRVCAARTSTTECLWTAHACQVIPGARNRWIVTMKFNPVRIDAKPTVTMPITVATTWVVDAEVLSGPS
jgi:hypothetical protein